MGFGPEKHSLVGSCAGTYMFESIGDDLNHLCTVLRCSPSELLRAVSSPESCCDKLALRRRRKSARPRIVWDVDDPLRRLQRHIALWLKPHVNALPSHVTAFRDDSSPFENASRHVGRGFVLNADLSDFYGSIDLMQVVNVFETCGVARAVAVMLGRLCVIDGKLMQGGRASPFVANLAARRLDHAIKSTLSAHCVYTRYVDDLTISSNDRDALPSLGFLNELIEDAGFRLRQGTYNIRERKGGPYVTGLHVGGTAPRIPRRLRRRIDRFLHFALITNVEHAAAISFRGRLEDPDAALSYVAGLIDWVRPIERPLSDRWAADLQEIGEKRALSETDSPP
jgi:hypothetical protein